MIAKYGSNSREFEAFLQEHEKARRDLIETAQREVTSQLVDDLDKLRALHLPGMIEATAKIDDSVIENLNQYGVSAISERNPVWKLAEKYAK